MVLEEREDVVARTEDEPDVPEDCVLDEFQMLLLHDDP